MNGEIGHHMCISHVRKNIIKAFGMCIHLFITDEEQLVHVI